MVGRSRVIAAGMACVLAAAPALAQPTAKQRQKAEGLVKQAIAKSQGKDHAGAIELYLEAYALVPMASLLSNVGTEYQTDGKPVEALKYFCMYLEKEPTGPLATYATAQATTIEAELGDTNTDTVCKPIVTKPAEPANVAPTATPPAQQPIVRTQPPRDPGRPFKYAGIVATGIGVANVGLGLYFGVQARKVSDQVTDHPIGEPWPEDIADIEARGARYEKIQIGTLIAGGVLVAAGVSLFFVGRAKTEKADGVAVMPTVSRDGGGLAIGGRF